MDNHERTVAKYYAKAIVMLQSHLDVAGDKEKLRTALVAERPRFSRKLIWSEAVNEVISYINNHKQSFRNGKLYA